MQFDHHFNTANAQHPQKPVCPYCHSMHIQLIDTQQVTPPSNVPSIATFSPMGIATIGMQMSKRLHLPPLLGGLAGLVIGGMVLLYLNYQKQVLAHYYQCEQCMQSFEFHHEP